MDQSETYYISGYGYTEITYNTQQQTWGYYGEAGTNGVEFTKPNGNTVVLTHGNPANMSMYETVKHLEGILPRLAQGVFR